MASLTRARASAVGWTTYLATHNYHGDVDLVMEELENLYLRWLIFTITRDFHDIFFNYVYQIWKEDLVNGIRSSKYP